MKQKTLMYILVGAVVLFGLDSAEVLDLSGLWQGFVDLLTPATETVTEPTV